MDELTRAYRAVFESQQGEIVLCDILSMLGHFANDPGRINPQCIAVSHTILSRLGAYSADGVRNYVRKVIEAGLKQDVV